MIKIIGKLGCKNCIDLKEKLTKEGKQFEYLVFEELGRVEKRGYVKIYREGKSKFPMVYIDENIIEYEDFNVLLVEVAKC